MTCAGHKHDLKQIGVDPAWTASCLLLAHVSYKSQTQVTCLVILYLPVPQTPHIVRCKLCREDKDRKHTLVSLVTAVAYAWISTFCHGRKKSDLRGNRNPTAGYRQVYCYSSRSMIPGVSLKSYHADTLFSVLGVHRKNT